jgi:hypothetical protein
MRFHPIQNRDYNKLRQIIDSISHSIGAKLSRNQTYDERGLTDELFDQLQTSLSHIKLSKYFINLHANKPSEKSTGADILLRIIVNRQEISFDRYVLIQAKKYLASTGNYSETNIGNSHLNSQVARMHKYNPEFSYIMLYSTTTEPVANVVMSHNYQYSHMFFDLEDLIYSQTYSLLSSIQHSYPVALLRSKTWEKFTDTSADKLLSYSETFSNFLLDDLVIGKIGINWDEIIEKAQGEFSIVITLKIGQG